MNQTINMASASVVLGRKPLGLLHDVRVEFVMESFSPTESKLISEGKANGLKFQLHENPVTTKVFEGGRLRFTSRRASVARKIPAEAWTVRLVKKYTTVH